MAREQGYAHIQVCTQVKARLFVPWHNVCSVAGVLVCTSRSAPARLGEEAGSKESANRLLACNDVLVTNTLHTIHRWPACALTGGR